MNARDVTPLLEESRYDGQPRIPQRLLWQLYVSHFLSTWNMRSYEFAVILLFASAYPQTLLPTSIRGVLTNAATLFLSAAIGSWADRNAARFKTIRTTIVVQRVCIVAACLLWIGVFAPQAHPGRPGPLPRDLLVALVILCSVVERVCAVGNQFVMERDWVPTIAAQAPEPPLHRLNAAMRRIDLVSKILAPVGVSVIAIRTSPRVLAAATAGMNVATVGVELASARAAWRGCAALGREREPRVEGELSDAEERPDGGEDARPPTGNLALYFSSDVCLASLSAALQSFSVLSLSGPMTTYLLSRHFSLSLITSARTLTSVLEISSTVVFPVAVSLLARLPARLLLVPDPIAALGLGGVSAQLLLLVPCFVALASLPPGPGDDHQRGPDPPPPPPPPGPALVLFGALGLSRVGLWTHNMAAQQLVQTRVPAARRAAFSGVETAFVSAAEIGRWAAAAAWSRPEQFVGVAAAGLAGVAACWLLFAAWVLRLRRRVLRDRG